MQEERRFKGVRTGREYILFSREADGCVDFTVHDRFGPRVGICTIVTDELRLVNMREFLDLSGLKPPVYFTWFLTNKNGAEDHRRDGIASELFMSAMDWLTERDCSHIVYFTDEGRVALRSKYLAQGYRVLQRNQPLPDVWSGHEEYMGRSYGKP